jgi:hypothetical protein
MRQLPLFVALVLASPSLAQESGDAGAAIVDGGAADDGGREVLDGGAAQATTAKPPAPPPRAVHPRSRLLRAHEALGIVTLVALAAANVVGSLDYYDKYSAEGNDTGQFSPAHIGLAAGATAAFASAGILSLVEPRTAVTPRRRTAARAHRWSMAFAAGGFAVSLALGPISEASDGKLFQRGLAITHLVVGWATFGLVAAGVLAELY